MTDCESVTYLSVAMRAGLKSKDVILRIFLICGFVALIGLCLWPLFSFLDALGPAPSPQPYPGVPVTPTEGSPGSWGLGRIYRYTADFSLDHIQAYFEAEMNRYCVSEVVLDREGGDRPEYHRKIWWGFQELSSSGKHDWAQAWGLEKTPDYIENATCRQAGCGIRRPGREQYFNVLLCSDSPAKTLVIQRDFWEDH